jgi:hypothetical protein
MTVPEHTPKPVARLWPAVNRYSRPVVDLVKPAIDHTGESATFDAVGTARYPGLPVDGGNDTPDGPPANAGQLTVESTDHDGTPPPPAELLHNLLTAPNFETGTPIGLRVVSKIRAPPAAPTTPDARTVRGNATQTTPASNATATGVTTTSQRRFRRRP